MKLLTQTRGFKPFARLTLLRARGIGAQLAVRLRWRKLLRTGSGARWVDARTLLQQRIEQHLHFAVGVQVYEHRRASHLHLTHGSDLSTRSSLRARGTLMQSTVRLATGSERGRSDLRSRKVSFYRGAADTGSKLTGALTCSPMRVDPSVGLHWPRVTRAASLALAVAGANRSTCEAVRTPLHPRMRFTTAGNAWSSTPGLRRVRASTPGATSSAMFDEVTTAGRTAMRRFRTLVRRQAPPPSAAAASMRHRAVALSFRKPFDSASASAEASAMLAFRGPMPPRDASIAHASASSAPLARAMNTSASVPARLDPTIADSLAEDIIRKIEKRTRIERERRGL